jgi:hypothetical protein
VPFLIKDRDEFCAFFLLRTGTNFVPFLVKDRDEFCAVF